MTHDALVLAEESANRPVLSIGAEVLSGARLMLVAALFVWAAIQGGEADPTALHWDVLFAVCSLLLIGAIARCAVAAGASRAVRPGAPPAAEAPLPLAARVLRGVATGAAVVGAADVWTMLAASDPRVWAAAAVTVGAVLLRAHLGLARRPAVISAVLQRIADAAP